VNYCYSTSWCQLLTRDYGDGECDILALKTSAQQRQKGHAKTVMMQVLADADAEGVTLLLTARAKRNEIPRGAMDQEQLEAWYERLGFITVSRDAHGNARMQRDPVIA
jgi:ribosomal protein S18 acetylase RimI-like enzyme